MLAAIREREDDDREPRSPKRIKTSDFDDNHTVSESLQAEHESQEAQESILPPSHILLGLNPPQTTSGGLRQLLERDVGISEYITRDLPPIRGIIKQRKTRPLETLPTRRLRGAQDCDTNEQAGPSKIRQSNNSVVPNVGEEHVSVADDEVIWDETFESSLSPFLSEASIVELKKMYLEGPEPPRVSDSGWSRVHTQSEDVEISEQGALPHQDNVVQSSNTKRGKHQNRDGRGKAKRS
ncbi:hypothetical protein JVT61DRAFT_12960 [Boletus reticuloceps]|uniref:Uncharacterized protein n=1 Tax=Boletus reticuloceps TaxID=495285 RepID=A0A8I2YV93_9AGAM|nr:hypothetical protein JVT61DRAFT_12960 [Boletus reticuloceps]